MKVINHYSKGKNQCSKCIVNDPDILEIDHINNGGAEHRRKIGNGGKIIIKWLIDNDFPGGFQILCCNCNRKKEILRRRNQFLSSNQ